MSLRQGRTVITHQFQQMIVIFILTSIFLQVNPGQSASFRTEYLVTGGKGVFPVTESQCQQTDHNQSNSPSDTIIIIIQQTADG